MRAALDATPRADDATQRSTSGRGCSSGTRDIDATIRGGPAERRPWLVLAAELCLARTRADLVPVDLRAPARARSVARALFSHASTRSPPSRRSVSARERRSSVEVARGARGALRWRGPGGRTRAPLAAGRRRQRRAGRSLLRVRPASGAARRDDGAPRRALLRPIGHAPLADPARPLPARRLARVRTPSSTMRSSTTAPSFAAPSSRVRRVSARRTAAPLAAASHQRSQLTLPTEVAPMPRRTTVIPSAARLMTSLRDIGYDLPSAVADLVDNSIDAGATTVRIDVCRKGERSFIRIADDGRGMTERVLDEAMRYGSRRTYAKQRARQVRSRSQDRLAEPVPSPDRCDEVDRARAGSAFAAGTSTDVRHARCLGARAARSVRVPALSGRAAPARRRARSCSGRSSTGSSRTRRPTASMR